MARAGCGNRIAAGHLTAECAGNRACVNHSSSFSDWVKALAAASAVGNIPWLISEASYASNPSLPRLNMNPTQRGPWRTGIIVMAAPQIEKARAAEPAGDPDQKWGAV